MASVTIDSATLLAAAALLKDAKPLPRDPAVESLICALQDAAGQPATVPFGAEITALRNMLRQLYYRRLPKHTDPRSVLAQGSKLSDFLNTDTDPATKALSDAIANVLDKGETAAAQRL